ncbi:UDP-N-acetylmuramoyl-L-alanyl-D-glutamate--2,6-diaminopimelate ligase [Pelomonas aquatica]|jgi:UDP-N-acetylmuramyl-tripeptide synthetase|uniref:UDP-N-acetylmuramoyl-L-alanyl-D-glutamate--2,6-diaminopimelate ligase n=1 Tax=Pelomonas aquatica TaxID=431058 RepID=A0A9X4LEW0_9BURK|nr:UDP-N-acetylmuramoyl-L-alanyl-D-glutamate--2,6-diaminopimelate ligase [Pelomonas aquatica]MCY4755666.1 UDP-N-acetylmuramoyl-L-alanyl-D-glutamate--2,6-diaminopimelate ligase [Pelomonas aquatica]MDG0862651.1 UDP-N-acetylmuramoyl-L-alanyl-D-glutamate--2,6-diaminopimelate ligase [Pelomonas aquatica]
MLTRLKSPEAAARWLAEWCTGTLRTDSRQVRLGDAFIAWPGYARDGREFVAAALAAGASTCLVEDDDVERFGFMDARVASLPGLKARTGEIAAAFFGKPTDALDVIAVTGTNGKTSSAWWIAQASSQLGQRCGVVGTLGIGEPPRLDYNGLTTPDPVLLQAAFAGMRADGFAACAIEASSIGIVEGRLSGSAVRVAVFTNFTQDHLDYHGSMDAYWAAKRALFGFPGLRAAVVNLDDAKGAALAAELAGLDVWTTGVERSDARLAARGLHYTGEGLAFMLHEGAEAVAVQTGLIGDYNAANLLGVAGALRAQGHALADVARVLELVTPVPGRMQRVGNGRELPQVVVDYAHTPDALDKALSALQGLAKARGGELVCVFGCGGDRDATKRPLMGAIAARLAGRVVITTDNPRTEAPARILADIAAAAPGAAVIEAREAAIRAAIAEAGAHDIVLIAGKGHEDYQEVNGVRRPFSDVAEARAALLERAGL